MKKSTVIILLFLSGFTCICHAEDWYAAQEGSSYDYVGQSGLLLSAKSGSSGSKYIPDYTDEDLQSILMDANNYSGIINQRTEETTSLATAPDMVSGVDAGPRDPRH